MKNNLLKGMLLFAVGIALASCTAYKCTFAYSLELNKIITAVD